MPIDQTDLFQLALYGCIDGIGRRTLRKVLNYRRERVWSWRDLWVPTIDVIQKVSLSTKNIASIQKADKEQFTERLLKGIDNHQLRLIGTESSEYPPLLKVADDPPPVLFVKGAVMDWQTHDLPIAIVGTRNMTAYGRTVTEKIATELTELGATIVSGLMYGVDTVAHQATVRAGGYTIAVLGYGFDHCYPPEHQPVLKELLEKGATFISEYPPWKIAKKGNFPARNSIVAAMSKAVVVTEAAEKSGSMITAKCANEEGREVCAVPGPITNPYCQGTKWLINEGATLITCGADVLEQIYRSPTAIGGPSFKQKRPSKNTKNVDCAELSPIGKQILDILTISPADLTLIQGELRYDEQVILQELTELELQLLIEKLGTNWRVISLQHKHPTST